MNNLEAYLRKNCEQNVIDHALRADVAADGTVSFYLHPNGVDGETLDYRVAANTLTPKFGVAEPNAGERFDCKRWLDAMQLLMESRECIAACFRTIAASDDKMIMDRLEMNLALAGVKDGIGVRLQNFIKASNHRI